jgi:hypothetical protein
MEFTAPILDGIEAVILDTSKLMHPFPIKREEQRNVLAQKAN